MPRRIEASELERHLGYWLRFVSNHVSHAFMRKLEAEGVTVAEWALMRRMYDAGAVSPSALAERMDMTRGAVSKLVDRLCAKGFAEKTLSEEDRRRQSVSLSAAGRKLVPKLARLADDNDAEFFGHLPERGRADLIRMLKDLVHRHGWKEIPVD